MGSQFLNEAIEQVDLIVWKYNQERTSEEIKIDKELVREYFRRLRVFLDYLNKDSNYPYIDPVELIQKESNLKYEEVEELCKNIKQINGIPKSFCMMHIIWNSMVDQGDPIAIKFKDLFEPLINLFQKGGYWSTEHGILDIDNNFLCWLSKWRNEIVDEPMELL